jgi:hypothetical protein
VEVHEIVCDSDADGLRLGIGWCRYLVPGT